MALSVSLLELATHSSRCLGTQVASREPPLRVSRKKAPGRRTGMSAAVSSRHVGGSDAPFSLSAEKVRHDWY